MVVQHNLTAMNSNRMLGITTSAQAKSTEKLSSGYKINRAADDAAGLSISEKMRKQIRGLTQASLNAEDGISAVQTAEGALAEVQDMLQRMNELAVKAANGTNSESDRSYIQDEIDQLTTEIDRVAETTKFNETYLLKGNKAGEQIATYSYKKFSATTLAAVKGAGGATAITDTTTGLNYTVTFTTGADQDDQNAIAKTLMDQGLTVTYEAKWLENTSASTSGYKIELNGTAAENYSVVLDSTDTSNKKFTILDADGNSIASVVVAGTDTAATATNKSVVQRATIAASSGTAAANTTETAAYYDKDGNKISANALDSYFALDSSDNVVVRKDAPTVYDALGNVTSLKAANVDKNKNLTADLTLNLHVGADATSNNQISLNIGAMSAKGLGVNGLKVDGTTDANALAAIGTISEAIQKVSTQRSALGAVQNRLEHTINNLDNVVENTTAAESQIRDTDMASEMVKYSNSQILSQAGQSMLAQANQANQGVLSLLG